MPDQDKSKRWRPRIRLWHLFVLITLAAVLVWLWPRLGLQLDHRPGEGSRAAIVWNGETFELWDMFPPVDFLSLPRPIILDRTPSGPFISEGEDEEKLGL